MIVRSGRQFCSMKGVSWMILLFSIGVVLLDVRSLRQNAWSIEAWTMTSSLSCKDDREIPKRIWGSFKRRRGLHLCQSIFHSMKVPQEVNENHDIIAIPSDRMNTSNFQVRDCTHGELSLVADIIMDSFYNYTDPGSVWKQLTKLAELNRVQQNFPYGPDKEHHRMMVVTTSTNCNASDTTTNICGFVDIDTRIPNRPTSYKYNPRPYLSDLCIHPNYRRYGLASLLIQSCEEYCQSHHRRKSSNQRNAFLSTDDPLGPEIYIRVETKNIIAIQMYQKLGYSILSDHADSSNPNILILYKAL